MIRRLIVLAILIIAGWVVYVSFYGTDEQKAKRDELFKGFAQTFNSIKDIVNMEKENFSQGEYKKAVDNIDEAIDQLKKADSEEKDYPDRIQKLEKRMEELENKDSDAQTTRELKSLGKDVIQLKEEMEKK